MNFREWELSPEDVLWWHTEIMQTYDRNQELELVRKLEGHLKTNRFYVGNETFSSGLRLVLRQACRKCCFVVVEYILVHHSDRLDVNEQMVYHPYRYFPECDKMDIADRIFHRKSSLLHAAAEGGLLAILKLLIDKQASVASRDCCGKTPLMVALMFKQKVAVEYLLSIGADPNSQDCDGLTPLMFAILYCQSSVEVLLNAGADPQIIDKKGYTAAHHGISCLSKEDKERTAAIQTSLKLILQDSRFILGANMSESSTASCPLFLAVQYPSGSLTKHYKFSDKNKTSILLFDACEVLASSDFEDVNGTVSMIKNSLKTFASFARQSKPNGVFVEQRKIYTTEQLDSLMSKLSPLDRKVELGFQCLIMMEHHLGYTGVPVLKFLFRFTKWASKNHLKTFFALFEQGLDILLQTLGTTYPGELKTLSSVIFRIAISSFENLVQSGSLQTAMQSMKLESAKVTLMKIFLKLFDCQGLMAKLQGRNHSHDIQDINCSIDRNALQLLSMVRKIHSASEFNLYFDVETLAEEMMNRCPAFVDDEGWPDTMLGLAIKKFCKPLGSIYGFQTNYYANGLTFVKFLLENGADIYTNYLTRRGLRLIDCVNEEVKQLLLQYGAHPDAAYSPHIEYVLYNSYKGRKTVSSLPLTCLAANVIVADRVPYRKLDIPPRISQFIALHDPEDIGVLWGEQFDLQI